MMRTTTGTLGVIALLVASAGCGDLATIRQANDAGADAPRDVREAGRDVEVDVADVLPPEDVTEDAEGMDVPADDAEDMDVPADVEDRDASIDARDAAADARDAASDVTGDQPGDAPTDARLDGAGMPDGTFTPEGGVDAALDSPIGIDGLP